MFMLEFQYFNRRKSFNRDYKLILFCAKKRIAKQFIRSLN